MRRLSSTTTLCVHRRVQPALWALGYAYAPDMHPTDFAHVLVPDQDYNNACLIDFKQVQKCRYRYDEYVPAAYCVTD